MLKSGYVCRSRRDGFKKKHIFVGFFLSPLLFFVSTSQLIIQSTRHRILDKFINNANLKEKERGGKKTGKKKVEYEAAAKW